MNGWFIIGAVAAFLGVAAGAFGAHALKARLAADLLNVYEVAVKYQMYHAIALLVLGAASGRLSEGWVRAAGLAFTIGIIVFSGSLYGLAVSGARWLGAITPIGGLAFLIGWISLIGAALGRR